jgi:hypothetical protein
MDEKTLRRMRREYPGSSDTQLESLYLYKRMEEGKATTEELVRLSYLRDMIPDEAYAEFLEMVKECGDED